MTKMENKERPEERIVRINKELDGLLKESMTAQEDVSVQLTHDFGLTIDEAKAWLSNEPNYNRRKVTRFRTDEEGTKPEIDKQQKDTRIRKRRTRFLESKESAKSRLKNSPQISLVYLHSQERSSRMYQFLHKKNKPNNHMLRKGKQMKIVVVDHVHLKAEHVKRLRTLGELKVFKEPPADTDELKERIKEADIAVVGWSNFTRSVLDHARRLKMISIWATTCHYVDLDAAKERGIVVTHVPGYATESVAEYTYALMLATIRRLTLADRYVRKGNFDWRPFEGIELAGKTLGVVGTGAIGFRVAEIGRAFRMQLLGFDKYPNSKRAEDVGLKYVDLETLLKESDVITIHVTLTSGTEMLIGKKEIAAMKQGAVIVNTSQGKVIEEEALIDALKSGKISCAGLDVLEEEPPPKNNRLFRLENTVLSPHIGFNTVEAEARCSDICVQNVVDFVDGRRNNVC
jgi:phosphoglycerate dehydrogenase-like enzyme